MSLLQYEQSVENLRTKLHLRNPRVVNVASEFHGMIIFYFYGNWNILSYEKMNTWIQVNLGWGLAWTLSVLICAKISGL